MHDRETTTADGTTVPLYWYPAENPRYSLLILPALGIQAKLYQELAVELANRGCSTCLLEQRGHGRSPITPGYSCNYTLDDMLNQDLPAALGWMQQQQSPELPLLLGGHSLGGHLSTIYAGQHPEQLAGILHLACAFPYYKDYPPRQRRLLHFLCAMIPMFSFVPGYYPGHLLGFAERESAAMMKQWRQWAVSGDFDFDAQRGRAAAVAAFSGPVLSLTFERDDFSSDAAVQRALSPYTSSSVTRLELGEKEQGRHLGHVGWARAPSGVADAISRWLATALAESSG